MSLADHFVSAIIPVYNGERFLVEAVQSVRAQGLARLEILVVDDGSCDGTAALLAGLGDQVRAVRQPNRGPAAARNHGLEVARGDVIAFLDVDDLWAPGALADLLAHLDAHPEFDIVQGLIQRLVLHRGASPGAAATFRPAGKPYRYISLTNAIFRRRVFDRVGRLDEAMRENEDTDWFIRAWEQNVAKAWLDRLVLLYRFHGANSVYSQNLVGGGLPRLFRCHRDRVRRGVAAATAAGRPHLGNYLGPFPPALPRPV